MREKTCCFTGHRNIPDADIPAVMKRTEEQIRKLANSGVTHFRVGGAVGYDTLAAKLLFQLRNTDLPDIKVILIYPFDGFTEGWSEVQKAGYVRVLPEYDEVIRAAPKGSRGAYLVRDRMLVDGAAHCICFCKRKSGGTAYTVRYAIKTGVDIYNIAGEI